MQGSDQWQISSVHTAAKPLAAQDKEKTVCSSMICFPTMWQCWRTIKITIVGGDGWSRKNMSRVTLWVCRPTSVTSAMTRRPPPRPWWLTCCRSSSTVLPPPASSSSPLPSLSSCDVVWRFYHILLEVHNVRAALKRKDWYFLGIFSKPVDPPPLSTFRNKIVIKIVNIKFRNTGTLALSPAQYAIASL